MTPRNVKAGFRVHPFDRDTPLKMLPGHGNQEQFNKSIYQPMLSPMAPHRKRPVTDLTVHVNPDRVVDSDLGGRDSMQDNRYTCSMSDVFPVPHRPSATPKALSDVENSSQDIRQQAISNFQTTRFQDCLQDFTLSDPFRDCNAQYSECDSISSNHGLSSSSSGT